MSGLAVAILLVIVPLAPLVAAGIIALLDDRPRKLAATSAIVALAISLLAALVLLGVVLVGGGSGAGGVHEVGGAAADAGPGVLRMTFSTKWLSFGGSELGLGLVLDPMSVVMMAMVSLVGLLIFIFSVGYMWSDARFVRFFGFLSFFAAAMLGVVASNSLLLLFICWELVGLASYLLIGFWFEKPAAVAACQKAFLTTRVADLGLFLGMLWLHGETGTLLFYDQGAGLLEQSALSSLLAGSAVGGVALPTVLALLIFWGACGKSGQFPLHVWLPDAMEGPTPVSALIHAATMVAAGVFLVARMFPLFELGAGEDGTTTALAVVAWVGAGTAVFAALIATAQNDIKRILAYSTISQLGFMMLSLGVGGMAAAMFHLIVHAFFKALLFLGAGAVIHGCHHEQDIRKLGGLSKRMRWTFGAYAVGMMALAGFPFFFSGFWSKEEILHVAHAWPVSQVPFALALAGTLLTAYYMSRQMLAVFFGEARSDAAAHAEECPRVMTVPLVILAAGAILLGVWGTPAWQGFHHFIEGGRASIDFSKLGDLGVLGLMGVSMLLVASGVVAAWLLYGGGRGWQDAGSADPLERRAPLLFRAFAAGFGVDAFYRATFLRLRDALAALADAADRWLWGGAVAVVSALGRLAAWLADIVDRSAINRGFDAGCEGLGRTGGWLAGLHRMNIQSSLSWIGLGAVALILLLAWIR